MALKEEEEPSESWWSHQIFPCMNYFKVHPIETILLISLVALIVYQLISGSQTMSPIIQRGGEGEAAAAIPSPPSIPSGPNIFSKIASGVSSGVSTATSKLGLTGVKDATGKTVYKGLSGHIGDQLSSGVGQPIMNAWDKTAAFRNSPGEYIKGAIYYILEIAVIFVVFFPCMSLFLIIMLCYFFIRPYIKYIKKL